MAEWKPLLCFFPEYWEPFARAIREQLGEERAIICLGGAIDPRLSHLVDADQARHDQFAHELMYAQAGAIDLVKTMAAMEVDEELNRQLQGLTQAFVDAWARRRLVESAARDIPLAGVVTTFTADVGGEAIIRAAADVGVPVVHLQHFAHSILPEDGWMLARHPGDLILTPGQQDFDWWARCCRHYGVPQPPTIITGHPLWDDLPSIPHTPHDGPPIILWAVESGANAAQTPLVWQSRGLAKQAFEAFLEAMERLAWRYPVVLKFRMGESKEFLDATIAQVKEARLRFTGGESVHITNRPVRDVIGTVDLTVTQSSNLSVESILAGVPTVVIVPPGLCLFTPEHNRGAAIVEALPDGTVTAGALADAIDDELQPGRLLVGPAHVRAINAYTNGEATRRAVAALDLVSCGYPFADLHSRVEEAVCAVHA